MGKYVMLQLPGQPAMTMYPPFYPLFISIWLLCFATPWALLKILSIGLTLFSAILLARLVEGLVSLKARGIAIALFVLNPITIGYSFTVMSEPLFITLTLIAFVLLQRVLKNSSILQEWCLGFVLGACVNTRLMGVLLIPCVFLALVYGKKTSAAWRVGLSACLLAGSFLMRNYWITQQLSAYTIPFSRSGSALLSTHRLLTHGLDVLRSVFGDTLLGWSPPLWIIFALLGFMVWSLGDPFRAQRWNSQPRSTRALLLAMGGYISATLTVLIFWDTTMERYAWPLLPWMAILFTAGLSRVLTRHKKIYRIAGLMVCIAWTASYGYGNKLRLSSLSVMANDPVYREPRETWNWVRNALPSTATLVSAKCAEAYLYAERACDGQIKARDQYEFRYQLLKSTETYILSRPVELYSPGLQHQEIWNQKQRWVEEWPEAFELVHHIPSEAVRVFYVKPNSAYLKAYTAYREALQAFSSNDLSGGMAKLDVALDRDPNLVPALNAYAASYYLSDQKLQKAVKLLHKAIQIQPNYAPALLNLARLYKRNGHFYEAQRYAARALAATQKYSEFGYLEPLIEQERFTP